MRALALVERLEVVAPHVDLAAHLEHRRDRQRAGSPGIEAQRDLADGADVLRHLLALLAVAAGGGLHQHARLVAQADRQAVELGLGDIGDHATLQDGLRLGLQGLALAPVDPALLGCQVGAQLLLELLGAAGLGIGLGADAQHGHAVAHGGKAVEHLAADALGRRIGRDPFGMHGFDRLQLAEQAVVFGVGNLGRVERVVAVGVVVQQLAQLPQALRRDQG